MKTFSREVREAIYESQNGYCGCSKECVKPLEEFHHLVRNTKINNKKYILFTQSPMNCLGINGSCHQQKAQHLKISDKQAQVYENYLQELKGN